MQGYPLGQSWIHTYVAKVSSFLTWRITNISLGTVVTSGTEGEDLEKGKYTEDSNYIWKVVFLQLHACGQGGTSYAYLGYFGHVCLRHSFAQGTTAKFCAATWPGQTDSEGARVALKNTRTRITGRWWGFCETPGWGIRPPEPYLACCNCVFQCVCVYQCVCCGKSYG